MGPRRDLDGEELALLLVLYDYEGTRQTSNHTCLTTTRGGKHHVTIPHHTSLRITR